MPSSDNEDVCIAGSSIKGEVEVKLVAKFLLSLYHWLLRTLAQQEPLC